MSLSILFNIVARQRASTVKDSRDIMILKKSIKLSLFEDIINIENSKESMKNLVLS